MEAISLSALSGEMGSLYSSGKHAKKTRLKLLQVLGILGNIPAAEGLPRVSTTSDLTTLTMSRYVRIRLNAGIAQNTINGELGYLRTICNYAIEQGYLDRAPAWRRLRLREQPTTLNEPLSVEDATRLFELLHSRSIEWEGHRLFALYALILMTGVRRDEALLAHGEDVKLSESKLDLVERRARFKTAASANFVPLPPPLIEILREWIPRSRSTYLFPGVQRKGPWTGGPAGNKALDQLQAAGKEVGIGHVTWHGLRHTYGTHALVHFKMEMWAVQRTMRHTDSRTTQRYLRIDSAQPLIDRARVINYRSVK